MLLTHDAMKEMQGFYMPEVIQQASDIASAANVMLADFHDNPKVSTITLRDALKRLTDPKMSKDLFWQTCKEYPGGKLIFTAVEKELLRGAEDEHGDLMRDKALAAMQAYPSDMFLRAFSSRKTLKDAAVLAEDCNMAMHKIAEALAKWSKPRRVEEGRPYGCCSRDWPSGSYTATG